MRRLLSGQSGMASSRSSTTGRRSRCSRASSVDGQRHLRLTARGVPRGTQALLVEHAPMRDGLEDEEALALREHLLNLLRDVLRPGGADASAHPMTNPTASSSANASSATAIRFKAPTSTGADVLANADRTGMDAMGMAKWTSITVQIARWVRKTTIGI